MRKIVQFRFSTVVLISGAPKHDKETAHIANTLQKVSGSKVAFLGVAGDAHQSLFSKVFASSSLLDNNEFEVTRAYNTYNEIIQDSPFIPYRSYTHYCNGKLMKSLNQQNFFKEVFDYKVSAIATVGNFSLACRIGEQINSVPR